MSATNLRGEKSKQQHSYYHYDELPSPHHYRLLKLYGPRKTGKRRESTQPDHFYGDLSVHPPGDGVRYHCLSYCWGDYSREAASLWIGEEERLVTVRANLAQALSYLQSSKQSIHLWIDSVCINQGDLEERQQQVQIMEEIYKRAELVVAHLGMEADGSGQLPEFFDRLELANLRDGLATTDFCVEKAFNGVWQQNDYMVRHGLPPVEDHLWASFRAFVSRPWFSRIWIVQEAVVAKNLHFVCGTWRLHSERVFHAILVAMNRMSPLMHPPWESPCYD
jgi:hypothetical protein